MISALKLEETLLKLKPILPKIAARAEKIDQSGEWPEESLRELLDAGFGGLCVPENVGGLGFGLLALAKVCEALGESCASTAMCFGMHGVASAVIAAKATSEQIETYLKPIAQGNHLTTLALSEPGTGSHFYFPETTLTKKGEKFVVAGRKSFVTNGMHADSMVVSAVSSANDAPIGEFSCVIVNKGASGLRWSNKWDGIGMRGNSSQSVELESITVPASDLLGKEGDQIWYVFEVVAPFFLTAMAGTYLGVAKAALGEAIDHLTQRHHSHSCAKLADQAVLQHKVGTLWSDLAAARMLMYESARKGDTAESDALPYILSAKAQAADASVRVTNEAMTLMGGIAYGQSSKFARHMRDARASHVMAPTTDILRTWTGRALLNKPLLGE